MYNEDLQCSVSVASKIYIHELTIKLYSPLDRKKNELHNLFSLESPMHTQSEMRNLLPRSRGTALHHLANNLSLTSQVSKRRRLAHPNAAAAWLHLGGPRVARFQWNNRDALGPRAMLMYVSNGPNHFGRWWIRLLVYEVVAKSRFFARLPTQVLQCIVAIAIKD